MRQVFRRYPNRVIPRNRGYFFKKIPGAPEEIRTPDPLVRSQVLYPAELRAREAAIISEYPMWDNGGERGIRTLDKPFEPMLP